MEKQKETIVTSAQKFSPGTSARKVRMALRLSQRELADMCGISSYEVRSFERNLPVKLDAKVKLLKGLWATKSEQYQNSLHQLET